MRSQVLPAVALLLLFGCLAVAVEPDVVERGLGGDIRSEHWGSLSLLSRAVRRGSIPLWSPHERGGYPLLADPQTSVLYPPAWAMAALLPWWNDRPTAMVAYYAAHTAWAALGLLLLLRFLGVRRTAALLAALVLILATRWIKARSASWIFPVAWWPWMLLALASLARRPRPLAGVLLGLAVAMAALSGYTPNAAHGTLLLALLAPLLVWMARRRPSCPAGSYYKRLIAALGVGLVVGVPLLLPNVLAARQLLPHTIRARLDEKALYRGSIEPGMLSEDLLLPPRDKPTAGYIGLAPLALLLGALLVRPSAMRVLLVGTTLLFALLSLGDKGWLLPWLVKNAVGFDLWRIPGNYLFGALVSVALLVGLAANDLSGPRRARARVIYALAALALLWPLRLYLFDAARASSAAVIALGSAVMLWLAGSPQRAISRVAMAALALLLLFDARTQAAATYRLLPKTFYRTRTDVLATYGGPDHRLLDKKYAGSRFGARTGYRELRGDDSTLELYRVRRYMYVGRDSANLMGAANVRFAAGRYIHHLARRRTVERAIIELPHFAPRAYLTRAIVLLDDDEKALREMRRRRPGTYAIFELSDIDEAQRRRLRRMRARAAREGVRRQRLGSARVVVDERERLVIEVAVDRPAALVVAEQHYPGWRASVDGRDVPLLRTNYRFRGVLLARGKHRVVMRYAPPLIRAALWGYWAALLGALGWMAWRLWSRRRATSCLRAPS